MKLDNAMLIIKMKFFLKEKSLLRLYELREALLLLKKSSFVGPNCVITLPLTNYHRLHRDTPEPLDCPVGVGQTCLHVIFL